MTPFIRFGGGVRKSEKRAKNSLKWPKIMIKKLFYGGEYPPDWLEKSPPKKGLKLCIFT
jgi:hypothetical protein